MTTRLQRAYENIAIPFGLEQRVLNACLAQEKPTATRYWVPAASLAACGAVLLVSLAATGRLDRWLKPQEELHVQPGGNPPAGVTIPTTNSPVTLSTTPTTVSPQTTVTKGTTANKITVAPTTPTSAAGEDTVLPGTPQGCVRVMPGDYESLTLPELAAHFGRRIQPAWLPEDMRLQQNSVGYGICHRNEEKMQNLDAFDKKRFEDGTYRDAAVIYDQNAIHYLGENNRTLSVSMSTAPYPRNLLGDMNRFDENVTVAGVAAKLAYYDDSPYVGNESYCYTVLFTVDGVEFEVSAWNLPRREFLKVVESIIE